MSRDLSRAEDQSGPTDSLTPLRDSQEGEPGVSPASDHRDIGMGISLWLPSSQPTISLRVAKPRLVAVVAPPFRIHLHLGKWSSK